MSKFRKIYVVNFSGHDMTAAYDHAVSKSPDVFIIMSEGNVNIFEIDRLRYLFDKQLTDFDPRHDVLLLSGSAVLGAIAITSLLSRLSEVSVLIWHARGREYLCRQIKR